MKKPLVPSKSTLCFILISIISITTHAQQRFFIDKGKISFTSDAPLEIIKASSERVKGVIDPETNQFAFSVDITSFKGFNNPLQKEHFNEKYMESDKYATAEFKGKIIEQVDFTRDGTYEVRAKGDLDIHGQKQVRIIKTKLTIKNSMVNIESNFNVPLADHKITIPNIISEKIATEIEVFISAVMIQQSAAYVNKK